MNSKTTLSITEARKKIFEIAEEVQKPGVYYTLTENGKPKAVIVSIEEYESLIETIEVLQEFPDLEKEIKETEKAVKNGEYKSWTTLEQLLAKEGFVLAEKANQKYHVSNKNRKNSSKKS